MKSDKVNYLVVGGFVIAMFIGLVVAVAVLTGRTGAADSYFAVYKNVTGVKFGSQVLYEGFPVGQVEDVTPMAKDGAMLFRVDLSVRKGWKIPKDSIAQIAASGLLSKITISIRAGKEKSSLEPGAQIKSGEGANIFAVMSSVADDVRNLAESDIKPLLATLNTTVGAFGGLLEGDLQDLVKDLVVVSQDMARRVPKITDDIESVAAQLNAASIEINALLNPENRGRIEAFLSTLDESAGNFRNLSRDLGGTREKADGVLAAVETLITDNRLDIDKSVVDMRYVMESLARRIDSVNQNLEGTARNMYEFSRQIRQNPGLLLGSTPPEDQGKRK